jgi:hypothetical protein
LKKWLLGAAVVLILIIAVWIFGFGRKVAVSSEDILITPTIGPFQVTITTTGELQAKNSVDIKGPANVRSARIWEMKIQKIVPEGTVVDSGAFVAELDKSELESKIKDEELSIQEFESRFEQVKLDCTLTLANARNDLINLEYALEERLLYKEQSRYEAPSVARQAEIDYDKAVRSLKQARENYITQVQKATAQMREAETELLIKKKRLTDYRELMKAFTIYAPKKGMVIYTREWNGRRKTEGSTVNAWDPVVATLPDLTVMQSLTYVSEVDIQKVKPGQAVSLRLDANPDKTLTGEIQKVANIGEQLPNSDSKVFEVIILIHQSDSTLRPAMTTSNEILVASLNSIISLPLEAVHANDSLSWVYMRNEGGIYRHQIQTGLSNDTQIEIKAGLEPEDKVFLNIPEGAEQLPLYPLTQ